MLKFLESDSFVDENNFNEERKATEEFIKNLNRDLE